MRCEFCSARIDTTKPVVSTVLHVKGDSHSRRYAWCDTDHAVLWAKSVEASLVVEGRLDPTLIRPAAAVMADVHAKLGR